MSEKTDLIRAELERIASENGGILMPAKVVEAARPSSSPLHSSFEWDDTEAAREYRLFQARHLISITVNILTEGGEKERVWVSLKSDRAGSGGYRGMVAVLSDSRRRDQLLQDALEDMEFFERKYRHLQELAEVFAATRRVRKQNRAA